MTQYATTQDVFQAYASLSPKERRMIHAVACHHLGGTRFAGPLDLIHEAVFLSAEGSRRWPLAVDFPIYLANCMRSVADTDRNRAENRRRSSACFDDLMEWSTHGADMAANCESLLIEAQERRRAQEVLASARASFEQTDTRAINVLDGMLANMATPDMLDEFNLTARDFAAAKKRVLRRIENLARL